MIVTAILALLLTPAMLVAGWDPNFLRFEGGLLMPLVILIAGVMGLLVLTGAPLLLIAGMMMLRLRGRKWALFGAVVALLPWSPAWPLGVIVGAWSLWALLRLDGRAAFGGNRGQEG
jgi:hypothetical protein